MNTITIVDYGLSNLLSVARAVAFCGGVPQVTKDPTALLKAEKIILPGVGAFEDGMKGLRSLGLDTVLKQKAAEGTPLLGICLGMQMLLEESEEFGIHKGLGLIPGRVVKIPACDVQGQRQRIPHIGWNGLYPGESGPKEAMQTFASPLLAGTPVGTDVYFVHSFEARPSCPADILASTVYGGRPVCAACGHDKIVGFQFHPEKSGPAGLAMLRRFITL